MRSSYFSSQVIAEWAVSFHAHLVALFFFTAVISLTMYGFFIYQFLMAIKNITTYETHKWSVQRLYYFLSPFKH